MLDPANRTEARLGGDQPLLLVVVDTEEEFDWSKPLSRAATATRSTAAQARAHRIFERYGIRPTYVVDYPVASEGAAPLRELHADGRCQIGAHLHPWVNPPHDEAVSNRNSYPGNLAPALERAKLAILTEAIAEAFGARPVIYKAGRYGVGPASGAALAALGYEIDMSVVPRSDFTAEEGPDFTGCGGHPYWFGPGRRLLEIPMSAGYVGTFARGGARLRRRVGSRLGRALRVPGVLARLGLFERIVLTPEGIGHAEHRRLTQALLASGHRVFSFTYHSPSLAPGNTPYVRTETELARFLDRFERYFEYFIHELGGRPATPLEVRALLSG